MAKLTPQVQEFAEAIQEAYDRDLRFQFCRQKGKPLMDLSELAERTALLKGALSAKSNVKDYAAYMGSFLVACFTVGDQDVQNPKLELPGVEDEKGLKAVD